MSDSSDCIENSFQSDAVFKEIERRLKEVHNFWFYNHACRGFCPLPLKIRECAFENEGDAPLKMWGFLKKIKIRRSFYEGSLILPNL